MPTTPLQDLLLRGTLNTGCDCQLATLGSFVFEFAFHEPGQMGEWHTSKPWSRASGVAQCLTLPPPRDGASASISVLDSQRACLALLTHPTQRPFPSTLCPRLTNQAPVYLTQVPWCIASHRVPWCIHPEPSTMLCFDRRAGGEENFCLHFLAWHGHHSRQWQKREQRIGGPHSPEPQDGALDTSETLHCCVSFPPMTRSSKGRAHITSPERGEEVLSILSLQ